MKLPLQKRSGYGNVVCWLSASGGHARRSEGGGGGGTSRGLLMVVVQAEGVVLYSSNQILYLIVRVDEEFIIKYNK
ncbi:hypothetical protein L6452_11385 [Arctium lappa]|uniref:Uncharacterized protein n=1 Tax=Arctium lappa TaxID=4217 RepID=A0ACB9DPZ0_ARCLA|nr:hypothetical protein L6452_11385 [Arctium lappa]